MRYGTEDVDVVYITETDKIKNLFEGANEIHVIGTPNIYTKRTLPEIDLKDLGFDNSDEYYHLIRRDVLYRAICDTRNIKLDEEINAVREANRISSDAIRIVLKSCKIGMYENELACIFSQKCSSQGSFSLAYPSIVGSGENSAILHYVDNNKKISDGDLVLCDMGCEYRGYASDITRTFPANGRFTDK
jgi:Xaa-Pro aminopeptidase